MPALMFYSNTNETICFVIWDAFEVLDGLLCANWRDVEHGCFANVGLNKDVHLVHLSLCSVEQRYWYVEC